MHGTAGQEMEKTHISEKIGVKTQTLILLLTMEQAEVNGRDIELELICIMI